MKNKFAFLYKDQRETIQEVEVVAEEKEVVEDEEEIIKFKKRNWHFLSMQ